MKSRNPQLDILRGVAVLAVIGHHHGYYALWSRVGGLGVDLFFVLSGFLISGLLFAEYKANQSIDFIRFFIRRGFKIYPAYYCFLLLFLPFTFRALRLSDFIFMQSYLPCFWGHGWTLSVEEHFYLLLPLVFIVSYKLFPRSGLSWFPYALPLVILFCLAIRISAGPHATEREVLNPTHVRLDTLFAGVTLGWAYHFRRARFLAAGKPWVLALGLIFLAPNFLTTLPPYWGYTGGLTANLIGFSFVLVWAMNTAWLAQLAGLQWVGFYSYSIYLWHWPLALLFQSQFPNSFLSFWSYVALSIGVGVVMAILVEIPCLVVRDHYFSSQRQAVHRNEIAVLPASPANV